MNTQHLGPVILDVQGLALTAEDEVVLKHPHVGGVIIFSRNYDNPLQLKSLLQHIKSIRPELILCVDQEGGRVQRLINGFTRLPKLKVLGDLYESGRFSREKILQISHDLGYLMALEVRSIGFDLSFAPVLDINKGLSVIMKDRAIHSDPNVVSLLAKSYIQGMHQAGMPATGKHFPGHGHVVADSHLELPKDTRTSDEIGDDMAPFKALVSELDAIMPAHILYPNIDPKPVGFSSYWLQRILRQQLNFQGAIISDDLTMEGATIIGNYVQRAQVALDAGCDFILVCNHREGALQALEGIQDKAEEATFKRRAQLKASLAVPSWDQLKTSPVWQQASQVMAFCEDGAGVLS